MNLHSPGTLIAGRYEVAGRPLLGGMGIVYLCLDRQTQRPVALKTFRPEFLRDRAIRDRFLREGTTWVNLGSHPHIVRAYGVEHIGDGREVYLVLEQIAKAQGREDASLRAWLTPGQGLPVEQALLIGLQIARGMRHAAERVAGFVHRDLKPENVLVGADTLPGWGVNRTRVTDFGLAAVLQGQALPEGSDTAGADLRKTQLTHGVVGTPLYMAPEQWAGGEVSAATDVYALGCVLFEMLNGEPAVAGRSMAELQRGHSEGRVGEWRGNVPGVVQRLVGRCLRLSPGKRYGSWREVEQALGEVWSEAMGQTVPEPGEPQAIERSERVALGWAQSALGLSYGDIGKAEVALGYFERARGVGAVEGKRDLEAAGLGHLGNAYIQLGDAQRAIGFHEQALAIAREIGDRHGEGNALSALGTGYLQLGDARRATGYHEQALAIRHEIGDRHGEGNALGNLGNAYAALGDARGAIVYHEQALAIDREIGDRRGEGDDLGNLGSVYLQLGDARRAIGYFEQTLTICREIGDRHSEGSALGNLGNAYLQSGDARRAIGFYEQALAIAHEIGDQSGEGNVLGNLGNAYFQSGDVRRAIGCHEQTLAIHRDIGDRRGEGADLGNLGSAYAALGDARRAIGYFEPALAIAREIGDRRGEGADLGSLGIAYSLLGDARRAIEYYEQALAIHREIGDVNGVAIASLNMAVLYQQKGNVVHALPMAQEAVRLFAQIGHQEYRRNAQALVARLKGVGASSTPAPQSEDDVQSAFEAFQRANTANEMQQAMAQYPFMTDPQFIRLIEQVVRDQVPPELEATFRRRLATLKSLAANK